MDDTAFRLVVPADVAESIASESEIASGIRSKESAESAGEARLNFDLATAATILTVVVSTAQLIEYIHKIAKSLIEKARKKQAPITMLVQGSRRDRYLTITADGNLVEIETSIRVTVS